MKSPPISISEELSWTSKSWDWWNHHRRLAADGHVAYHWRIAPLNSLINLGKYENPCQVGDLNWMTGSTKRNTTSWAKLISRNQMYSSLMFDQLALRGTQNQTGFVSLFNRLAWSWGGGDCWKWGNNIEDFDGDILRLRWVSPESI
jgi:hypothetical protein